MSTSFINNPDDLNQIFSSEQGTQVQYVVFVLANSWSSQLQFPSKEYQ